MTKFAFFDLDKTLYDGWSTMDFYYLMAESGWASKETYALDRKLQNSYRQRTQSYDEVSRQVIELGIRLLKGYNRQQVLEMEDEFIKVSQKFYAYTRPLIQALQREGFICYIISAATFPPVEAIARELNVPYHASEAVMADHVYTGELKLFLNGEAKAKRMQAVLAGAGQPTFSLAFGDSTGDLPLLEAADKAFVVNYHQDELVAVAKKRGFRLTSKETIVQDVTAVLRADQVYAE